ncbi:MAG: diguanylate cyclase [Desulfovibrio sp.]|uniref:sensor domain-containing diguanylate cyclase n=1 Tax=Desulfovibrio sp. 7SRBS1 TaxID=3378064 RepID=UPI003B3E08F0
MNESMSLKTKLLTSLSVLLFVSFLATSLINYEVTRQSIREELLNSSLPLTGKNIYSDIHSDMLRPLLVSSAMANDTFLKDWAIDGEKDLSKLVRYLSEIKNKYGFSTVFFVSNKTDNYYYNGGTLKRISPRDEHDVWYYSFVRTNKKYDLIVDTNQAEEDSLTVFINYRIEDFKGRLLGVTGVGVQIEHATNLLLDTKKKYNRDVYLVDYDGRIQIHPNISLIGTHSIRNEEGIKDLANEILTPHDAASNFEFNRKGRHILLSTRYLPDMDWFLLVEQDEGVSLGAARRNLVRTLAVGGGVSIIIIFLSAWTINYFQRRLELLVRTDPLTGAANRRGVEEQYVRLVSIEERTCDAFSAVLFDVDSFKDINDTFGHRRGDEILQAISRVLQESIRPSDVLARLGGDEFLILLSGTLEEATAVFSHIHESLEKTDFNFPITFSCGLVQYVAGESLDEMLHRADMAMYRAKGKGGNRLELG